MITGFKTNIYDTAGNASDFGDLFIPRVLFSDGGLWSWGKGNFGQLGNNAITNRSSPVQTVSGGTLWKSVASGYYHIAAIKTDGTLWSWGYNQFGQLGDNVITHKSSPVQTVSGGTNWKLVSCKFYDTAAIKTDGTLWLWGYNAYGELGDNSRTYRSSPVQTVAGGTNWKLVSFGADTAAAIKTDGTLWLWGGGIYGTLGDNTTTNKSSPVQTVAGGTNWKSVTSGHFSMACIKTDGTLWTWGKAFDGALGDNSTTNKSSPVQTVAGGTNWKSVSIGNNTVLAIKTDGTLWAWGDGNVGQLGDNTRTKKSSPVQTVSGGTSWKSVNSGTSHSNAIKTDGTLWLWGTNVYGQLGDNTIASKSSPVQTVAGGTNWKLVAGGIYHTAAIKDDNF